MNLIDDKPDMWSLMGAMFIAGYITCLAVNNVSQLWSEHGQLKVIETKTVPHLKARVGCEHWRASVADQTGTAPPDLCQDAAPPLKASISK